MPYNIKNNTIVPSISTIFTNEAGVTYCMITPVILGILHLPLLIISIYGLRISKMKK